MRTNSFKGFSLVETLVATALFVGIGLAVYFGFSRILILQQLLRNKTVATTLANEQIEIIRNLPYSDVGTTTGIPYGKIVATQNQIRDNTTYSVNTIIRNIDDPFDGTIDGSPDDLSPADRKLVEVTVSCSTCKSFTPIIYTTNVGPKNLETISTNGALVIKALNANGQPVSGASVTISNTLLSPQVLINDLTGVDGTLTIVDAPPSVEGYKITVTKAGYSTDQTYPTGGSSNPNPTKPNLTVVAQQITQASFIIDQLSTINFSSTTTTCAAVPSIDFTFSGTKTIGNNPVVLKYAENLSTNGSGLLTKNNLEWDTYDVSATDDAYDLIGTNPLLTLGLSPNTTQNLQLVMAAKNSKRLLVVVRDPTTSLPIADADVTLSKQGGGYTQLYTTGQGYLSQTDWSGGSGQSTFTDPTKYFSGDSTLDYANPIGDVKLKSTLGIYFGSGTVTSSTFDTGGTSNFRQIFWSPQSQQVETGTDSVKFQIATNIDQTTWNFKGPDGTSNTYYTTSNQNINSVHNGDRYFRYKLFLSTADPVYTHTPVVSDVSFTFTSSCTPPGQVSFGGLTSGTYDVTVVKSGYQTYNGTVSISSNWQKDEITMSP